MRIREFRGKDTTNEWRYGGIYGTVQPYIIHDLGGWGTEAFTQVDSKTVGQFTGAVDCEGKNIYEYDFVVFVEGGKIPKIVLRSRNHPEFRLYSCALEGFNVGYSYELKFYDSREAFKVVGNIFDNPELIQNEVYERLMEMIKNDDT